MPSGLTRWVESGFSKRTCDNKEIWSVFPIHLFGKRSRARFLVSPFNARMESRIGRTDLSLGMRGKVP